MFNKKIGLIISLILVGIGILGAINILLNGEQVMGINNQIPWGILIAGYVFFAVSSTGVGLVSSLGHVFHIKKFEILSKRALLISIILLLCGFGVLALELANPLHLIYILFSPNLKSPIWWMGAFYSIYLLLLFAEFYYSLKEDQKKVQPIANVAFIVKLAAVSNLGVVFGMLHSRPFWHGPYFSLYMIVTAVLCGTAILSIIFYLIDQKDVVVSLGKILAFTLAVTLIFTIWKILTGLYGRIPGLYESVIALVSGPLSLQFWVFEIFIGLILPLAMLLQSGFRQLRVFYGAILTIIGALFMRMDFVSAGQITPLRVVAGFTNQAYNTYTPGWSEWALIIGALGATIFLYMLGEEKFDLDVKIAESTYPPANELVNGKAQYLTKNTLT